MDIPQQAKTVSSIAEDLFGEGLVAVYLHGSAVTGGLKPQSDVDLLVAIAQPMAGGVRAELLARLLRVSGRHPRRPGAPRPIELMVVLPSYLAAPAFPGRSEFVYGEWLREGFEAGEVPTPVADLEITLVLAQARIEAKPLFGPKLGELLAEIPAQDVRRAMREGLPALMAGFEGDERNVLLTLARIWRTAATGEFVAKDVAADWCLPHLPEEIASVLAMARDAYAGRASDDWTSRRAAARDAADRLYREAAALL